MVYRFGVFEFDGESGELRKNGRAVAIEPQPRKALALLLARAGDVVGRDELREAVWPSGTHVDFDRGLAYCVSQIRTALGDSGDNPRFVQTIPKRGFKFIAPVNGAVSRHESAVASPAPPRFAASAVAAVALIVTVIGLLVYALRPQPSGTVLIAVSVFDNETGNAEFDRPVAALSDLVVEHLTKIDPHVAVIGNAAALRQPRNIRNLKTVATSVRADYVLLGQLQRGETGLRFITHFIRLRDEAHLEANRLPVDPALVGLESAVVQEFDRAVRQHILNIAGN